VTPLSSELPVMLQLLLLLLDVGLTWSCSWSVSTTKTRRWRPTGPSRWRWASTPPHWWSSDQALQGRRPISASFTGLCRWRTSAGPVETRSR